MPYERVDKYWNVTLDHTVWTFSDMFLVPLGCECNYAHVPYERVDLYTSAGTYL